MKSAANRYTLYGALFGACFPLCGTLLAAWLSHGGIGLRELIEAQRDLPLLWIIDSAPLWLGLFARFGGMQVDRLTATHARLLRSEQRFRSVVDELGEGVLLADLDGAVTYANARAAHLLACESNALAGQTVDALVHNTAQPGGGAYETVELRRDGVAAVTVEVRRSTVQAAGVAAEGVVVLTDVTDRMRLEEQLRQSQKMDAVGQLAGGIAHDFNNMLTAISGYAAMLETELDAHDGRLEYAREIGRAASRAAELTRHLLAFSRKQVLQPRVFDVNDVLVAVDPMLRRLIGADIEVVVRRGADLPPVIADPAKLEQVLLNLVVNARDAMAAGGLLMIDSDATTVVTDDARFGDQLSPGHYIVLRVTDNGCGMDRDTMRHIFEPFYTTKPLGKGTGLGLSTVYGIVKQTGGHISVASEPGLGTHFDVYLPCADVSIPAVPQQPDAIIREGAGTILVAEDEVAVRLLISARLRRLGYHVVEAADGVDALALVDRGAQVDLLLSDVVMPKLGGPGLARELLVRFPGLPVIFMSGYSDQAIASNGELQAGTTFLQKPFTLDALTREVQQSLPPGIVA